MLRILETLWLISGCECPWSRMWLYRKWDCVSRCPSQPSQHRPAAICGSLPSVLAQPLELETNLCEVSNYLGHLLVFLFLGSILFWLNMFGVWMYGVEWLDCDVDVFIRGTKINTIQEEARNTAASVPSGHCWQESKCHRTQEALWVHTSIEQQ